MTELEFYKQIDTALVNYFGRHEGLLVILVAATLAGLLALILSLVVVPMHIAYLEGAYPDATLRPADVAGRLASLRVLERYYRWILGKIPFVKDVPPVSLDELRR